MQETNDMPKAVENTEEEVELIIHDEKQGPSVQEPTEESQPENEIEHEAKELAG